MKYRKLGRTGLDVSELVFGCGNVGGIMIRTDDDTMRAVVGRALDAGINWFDTAAQYGQGQSEINLGRMLKELGATPHISTKVRLDTENLGDIAGDIERALTASLERLGVQSVELYQLHNGVAAETDGRMIGLGQVLGDGAVVAAMERMRDQGLINYLGFTALGEMDACQELLASGRVDNAQVYYNMINPTAGHDVAPLSNGQDLSGLIQACADNNVGVIAIRTLAAGVLATDERHGRESLLTPNTELAAEEHMAKALFDCLRDSYGTRAQTALRFVLAHPDVSCIDFAAGEVAHLDEALAGAEMGPLPDDAMAEIRDIFESEFSAA